MCGFECDVSLCGTQICLVTGTHLLCGDEYSGTLMYLIYLNVCSWCKSMVRFMKSIGEGFRVMYTVNVVNSRTAGNIGRLIQRLILASLTSKVTNTLFFFSRQQIQELEATLYNALQQDKVLHVSIYS